MAIQSVKFKLNGQTYNLSFDSTEGVYKAMTAMRRSLPTPRSPWTPFLPP